MKIELASKKQGPVGPQTSRVVHSGSPIKNAAFKYPNNKISNTKYTWYDFIPKNLYEQFRLHINRYFLVIAILQCFPSITPVNPVTTWVPLLVIFAISATKEGIDDRNRAKEDKKANEQNIWVYRNGAKVQIQSQHILVGDLVWLKEDDSIVCDLVLLKSSDAGHCFIQTTNLDGETNLKDRQAIAPTQHLTDEKVQSFQGVVQCGLPDKYLYKFDSRLWLESSSDLNPPTDQPLALSADQLLQQGCKIRNTGWVIGLAVYTGNQTKFGNNKDIPPLKLTKTDLFINNISVGIFIFQLVLVLILGIIGESTRRVKEPDFWYLIWTPKDFTSVVQWFIVPLRFLLLNSTMIPISLKVSLDLCKAFYAKFINADIYMRDPETGEFATANSTSISEDLGQVEFVLSDKTGTLTQNNMVFDRCTIAGHLYEPQECQPGGRISELVRSGDHNVVEFFRNIVLNNGVVAVKAEANSEEAKSADAEGFVYKGASPDEVALVRAAAAQGVRLRSRLLVDGFDRFEISINGKVERHTLLTELKFTSDRKRMSVVLRDDDTHQVRMYTKGADDVLVPRTSKEPVHVAALESTQRHVDACAEKGLRTLFLGYRNITPEEFAEWRVQHEKANTTMEGREQALANVYDLLEREFIILGASAIEDKLQENVPETIELLRRANIKFWMLTGDKFSTALQIATACRLKSQDSISKLFVVSGETHDAVRQSIEAALKEQGEINHALSLRPDQRKNSFRETAVIVTGENLKLALPDHLLEVLAERLAEATKAGDNETIARIKAEQQAAKANKTAFGQLCLAAHTVIGCRVSPAQKAELVKMVKDLGKMTLAIGDGGNDVAMIQAAHVGVGIRGKEGLQAVRAADYAISAFQYLKRLVLIHGQYSYMRTSLVALYSFYKSMFFCLMQIFYSYYSHFSGVTLFNTLCVAAYNALLFFPIVTLVMDKVVPFQVALQDPTLYHQCAQGYYLNVKRVFWWMVRALYQAVIVFAFSINVRGLAYHRVGTGWAEDYDTLGVTAFLLYLWIQSTTLHMELSSVTWINIVAIWGFHIGAFMLLLVTNVMRSLQSYNGYKIVNAALADFSVWLLHCVGLAACVVPVAIARYDQFNYRPSKADFLTYSYLAGTAKFEELINLTQSSLTVAVDEEKDHKSPKTAATSSSRV